MPSYRHYDVFSSLAEDEGNGLPQKRLDGEFSLASMIWHSSTKRDCESEDDTEDFFSIWSAIFR